MKRAKIMTICSKLLNVVGKRFVILIACLFAALTVVCPFASAQDLTSWESYKVRFISQDGRVVDIKQDRISHSEGQGYGMILSVHFNDRASFDRLWQWTKNNLQVRADGLLAWSWGKRITGSWEVIDYNNASDGDILIAWALLQGAKKWPDGPYRGEATKLIQSIRDRLVVDWQGLACVLPGYYGFIKKNEIILNPSYFVLPAYRAFAGADDRIFWEKVHRDSLSLIAQASIGSYNLPVDWFLIDKGKRLTVYKEKSAYHSYDAIRVLLYLSMEDKPQYPGGAPKMLQFYQKNDYIPCKADVVEDSISIKSAPAGFYAVYAQVAQKLGDENLSRLLSAKASELLIREEDDYYSHTLYLLAASGGQ
jgi:endo-1,4-beta-D-glucanase Y